MFSRFFFSYQLILDPTIELLTKSVPVQYHEVKGCLYILLGNDTFFMPTKHSWTVLEKLWPALASSPHLNKPRVLELINFIMEKICKRFNSIAIIEETNEASKLAASRLWRSLNDQETVINSARHQERNESHTRSYRYLMEKLTSMIYNDTL